MKIVQLSDVHFGAQFRDDVFNQVIDEVNELSPDAVIITGDLTNEGLKEEYEGCKELISKINVKKIVSLDNLINHNYKKVSIEILDIYISRNIFHFKQLMNLMMM